MQSITKVINIAITSVLAGTVTLKHHDALAATSKMEKCYGIVKAGMNDCQTATHSCAGSATKDKQADAFIFLPKGVCERIVDGKLTAPVSSDKAK